MKMHRFVDLTLRRTIHLTLLVVGLLVVPVWMVRTLVNWFEPDLTHVLLLGWVVWFGVVLVRNRDKIAAPILDMTTTATQAHPMPGSGPVMDSPQHPSGVSR